ncbi:MAG: hypothetical protein KBT12_06940 [Bacteroidales bacterium]|nr:hypothetical protein [Candidatus Physcousia equi]
MAYYKTLLLTFVVQIYKEMLKVLLLCLGIIALAMIFLSIAVIFGHRHTFRSLHIGQSKAMRDRGIHCVQSMDKMERREANNRHRVKERI